MTRPVVVRASRRGLLGGLLGGTIVGVTATACELDPGRDAPARPDRTHAERTTEAPAEDPDAELVRRAVGELAGTHALVAGVARAGGPLAARLAPWRRLHEAHLEALEGAPRRRTPRVRGGRQELLARVRRRESQLQRSLADAAVAAESGALASLLAQMSAAVAQQLAADSASGGQS